MTENHQGQEFKVIKLKPQRIKPGRTVSGWVWKRDLGYNRDWRCAIDYTMRKELLKTEDNWLQQKRKL